MRIEHRQRTVVHARRDAPALAPAPVSTIKRQRPVPDKSQEDAVKALRHLLAVEGEIRACRSVEELTVLLVTELRRMTAARVAYLLDLRSGKPRLRKASGTGEIDANAPAVRWLEREVGGHLTEVELERGSALTLEVGPHAQEEEGRAFPFSQGYWLPLSHGGAKPDLGVLVVGEVPFSEGTIAIGLRIAETAAHAAVVLKQTPRRSRTRPLYKVLLYASCGVVAIAMFYPVPMTALAPMEVVPKDPFVVAAPIDGVIDNIVVAPNSVVKAGDVIVRYVDTVPRNKLQIAEQEVSVAAAKLRQLQRSAFIDESAKREIAQSRAELKLKIAERDFARDTFDKSQIRSPQDGIAVYADRKEWVGKPVSTGQRIIEIAEDNKVRLRADLPVAEVLNLKPGARFRAFLNGDPLNPIDARVVSLSHQARMVEGQGLVYRVDAEFGDTILLPRPGARGTAQLFSDKAPLGYYLFRRPLTWIRQKVGL